MKRTGRNHQVRHQHGSARSQLLPECWSVAPELVTVNPVIVNQCPTVDELQRNAALERQVRVTIQRVGNQSAEQGPQPLATAGAAFEQRHDILCLGRECRCEVLLELLPHLLTVAR